MSNLFKDLIKINAVKSKNVFLYSKYARDKKINIYKDYNTDVIFIKKKPDNYYYQKKSYEKDILSIKKYKLKNPIKIYDQDNIRRVNYIKSSYNKTILDIGSANSDFLQLAKKNFKIAEGVEPNEKQRKQTLKHFKIYKNLNEVKNSYDVITAFHVLEHVPNQIKFIESINNKLNKNGILYLEIPCAQDFLLNLNSYRNFILWSEHLVLHTKNSIIKLLKFCNFKNISVNFVQRYDINNLIGWLIDGKPGGHEKYKYFKKRNNLFYKSIIEKKQISDTIFISAKKK